MTAIPEELVARVGEAIPPIHYIPDELSLFLFSAAIWAPHRIHYDRDFARAQGHTDTVVQGPLQGAYLLKMIASWADARGGRVTRFKFTNRAPAYVSQELVATGTITSIEKSDIGSRVTCDLWLETSESVRTTLGQAEILINAAG